MDTYNQPQQTPYRYIGFGDAIQICLRKYATFSGRADRAEYWWWMLFNFIISAVCGIISGTLLVIFKGSFIGSLFTLLNYAVALAFVIPSLAVAWRRMHDIGKGGGWYFINFIPLVGTIIWIVWCCRKGEPVPNRFGAPEA